MIKIAYRTVGSDEPTQWSLKEGTAISCNDEFFHNLLIALASNSEGDASCLYEWYEPIAVPKGNICSLQIDIDGHVAKLEGSNGYESLASLPAIACFTEGGRIGSDNAKYVFDLSKAADEWLIGLQFPAEPTSVFKGVASHG